MSFKQISKVSFLSKVVLAASVAMTLSTVSHAAVWETTRQWDDAAEQEFGIWIRNLKMDIFKNPSSPYHDIATDCAHAAYTLRIIFASEHGLPIKLESTPDVDLSNDNPQFDSQPTQIAKVRRFIGLMKMHKNTDTLVDDTYPIAINRKTVHSGALFLNPANPGKDVPLSYRAGHVYYIQDVYDNGMVKYMSSTVPEAVRDLEPRYGITFAPFGTDGGYRAWKRPNTTVQPGESLEQFKFAHWFPKAYLHRGSMGSLWVRWQAEIVNRLARREMTVKEKMAYIIENVRAIVKERNFLVQSGWKLYQTKYHGNQCLSKADYDDYSTPTRDVKLQNELSDLREVASIVAQSTFSWSGGGDVASVFAQYKFEVMPGKTVDLNQLYDTFMTDKTLVISEPEHSPAVRWGLAAQGKWPCPNRAKEYFGHEHLNQQQQPSNKEKPD